MATEESKSPKVSIPHRKRTPQPTLSETKDSILSPGFRSAAAVAGWDEEALLLATLIVEDTPVRESRSRKRPHHPITSPPSNNSTRKRRSARRPPDAIPPIVLCLDEDDDKVVVKEKEGGGGGEEEKGKGFKDSAETAAAGKGLACMDRLREELSCAICLEICFEPSTTPCGHSFCLKCLKCAAAKCGKRCPKCRQIISIGRACVVNTVLWNTIQLLFPEVVEERKKAITATSRSRGGAQSRSPESIENRRDTSSSMRSSSSRIAMQAPRASENYRSIRRRRPVSNQAEDAALALRLQREEFMVAFQDNRGQTNTDRIGGRHRYA